MSDMKTLESLQASLLTQKRAIDRRLKVVEEALRLLADFKPEGPARINSVIPEDLVGLTQVRAIEFVAKKNNGAVTIQALRPLLEQSGIMKKTKNWYNNIYTVITRSGLFQHTGKGEYRLLDDMERLFPPGAGPVQPTPNRKD